MLTFIRKGIISSHATNESLLKGGIVKNVLNALQKLPVATFIYICLFYLYSFIKVNHKAKFLLQAF